MAKITLEAVISASAKGLKAAMDAARSAVRTASDGMKRAIGSIGDAFQKPIDRSKELKKGMEGIDGKQLLSSLTGFAGKLAIITAGCKAVGQILWTNWLKPIIEAKKNAAEIAQQVTQMNAGTLDKRVNAAMGKYEELKKLAQLMEGQAANPTAEGAYNVSQQQKRISDIYGVDASRNNLEGELKKAYDEGREQAIEALKGQIATLDSEQASNSAFLKSWGGRTIKNMGEWDRVTARNDAIKGERIQLLARIRELEKGTDAAGTIGGIKARTEDRTQARRKELAQAGKEFRAYESSQTDTALQKSVREVMERYRQAIKDGIDPARAKAAAERDIAKAMDARYKDYLDELKKRGEALRQARQKELVTQDALLKAQRDLADAEKAAADEKRREASEDRRRRLNRRLEKYGFDTSAKRPTRRQRRDAKTDSSIAEKQQREAGGERVHYTRREKERIGEARRMERELRRMDRNERREQRGDARTQAQRRVSDARRRVRETSVEATGAARQRQQAQRGMKVLRNSVDVRDRLREQAGKVVRDYRSDKIETPLIGGNSSRMMDAVEATRRRLNRDMQELERRYQTPKQVNPRVEIAPEAKVTQPKIEIKPEATVTQPVVDVVPKATVAQPRVEVVPEARVAQPVAEASGPRIAPGIGGNWQALATAYTGQLEQLHRDLKEMQSKAYIVR